MVLNNITDAYAIPETLDYEAISFTLSGSPAPLSATTPVYEVISEDKPKGFVISLKGSTQDFKAGDIFAMSDDLTEKQFRVISVTYTTKGGVIYTNLEYKCITDDELEAQNVNGYLYKVTRTQSACAEVPFENLAVGETFSDAYDSTEHTVENYNVFDEVKGSLPFINATAKLKIFAKTPGTNGNSIDVGIANVGDFAEGKVTYLKGNEIDGGIILANQFDYVPYGEQFAVIVMYENEIVETFIVSFDETEKNDKNEFIFAETAINGKSDYILVSVNSALPNTVKTCLGNDLIKLSCGSYSEAGEDDILAGYDTFSNKEEMDVDIIIGNEVCPQAATSLAIGREDCVAYIGAPRSASVGLKASVANTETVAFRREKLRVDSKYCALYSNYKYQYCSELGGNRWINLAGDAAGVRAKTNFDTANWYPAAGLNRGIIKNVVKLAVSPNQSQRDVLYKAGINPIITDISSGSSMIWGQKTLQTKASSFDRINVVNLFNHLERSLGRMSKYMLFEFNDEFQRSYAVSLIKPFLSQVKSGRGISDFMVICNETNNTAQVIANNQFVIDVYVKPNYSAEFIYLRFTNVGTNDFSIVTGSAS